MKTGTMQMGGDLAHDDKVHCSIMVVGAVKRGKALTRSGAQPGDQLYVSGTLGKPWDQKIVPRLALGRKLSGKATACIDLSDGLADGAWQLARASGFGITIEADAVPIERETRAWFECQGPDALASALTGGDDYELLFTMSPTHRGRLRGVQRDLGGLPITRIGVVTKEPGVRLRGAAGGLRDMPGGYEHFRSS